ncbi:hypothetical protein XAC40_1300017 [Xanthomonas citri pv. citri]|nr:hypothetical protein XAC40_1300017 [Xanthomonas citri pv. citri]
MCGRPLVAVGSGPGVWEPGSTAGMSRADERQRGKVFGVYAFASFSLLHGFAGGIRMGVR